jgi:Flp pilus assembly protein TadG
MMKMRFRKSELGSNIAFFAVFAVLLMAMLGISIYVGLQGFVQSEIQKAATTAAMAGASAYYSGNPGGRPAPDAGKAIGVAKAVFGSLVANSGALKGLGVKLDTVTNNDSNDSITVTAHGALGTNFLAPVGINTINVNASGTARAIKYVAAGVGSSVGPITLMPDGSMASMQQTLELVFPLVDNPGTDLYIEQAQQVQYAVEACNSQDCYDLVDAAQTSGTGKKTSNGGSSLIMGTCTIDLAKAHVRKASKLRFTHGNVFSSSYAGSQPTLSTYPTPAMLTAVYIFGYASACPDNNNCPIPAGFLPVE